MSEEIKPVSFNQPQNIQGNKEKKDKQEPGAFFEQTEKDTGKPKSPAEALAALNKEVPDDAKAEQKGDKGDKKAKNKPGGGAPDPDTITSPLLQAALGGDTTSLNQLYTLLSHKDSAMVTSAQKAINTVNNSKSQQT